MKPIIDINEAYIIGPHLYGVPVNYPEEHMYYKGAVPPGEYVRTSAIVKHEGNTVETMRTIYNVLTWSK